MTKRELIDLLEANPLPDDTTVLVDVSHYDEEDDLTDGVAIDGIENVNDTIYLGAAEERMSRLH